MDARKIDHSSRYSTLRIESNRELHYKRRAAKPAAARKPGTAVCMAPAALDEEDEGLPAAEVAPARALEALELAPAAPVDAAEAAEEATLEPLARMDEAELDAVDATDDADDANDADDADDADDTDDADDADDDAEPAPPAPPAPKMVVEPTVAVPVTDPAELVSVLRIAEVVMAEEDPYSR